MTDLYKSRHAGLFVKVRSALNQRHPVTGDIIGGTPAVWCSFGEPGGQVNINNPLTGEFDTIETFRGGTFSISAAADEHGWDEDVQNMVRRRLDQLCKDRPAMIEKVDYVVAPAERPWPTYDEMHDLALIAERAAELGLAGKAAAYERENLNRADLIEMLEVARSERPDPEPEPPPVLAVTARPAPETLNRLIVA